jgi:hypothetical protein
MNSSRNHGQTANPHSCSASRGFNLAANKYIPPNDQSTQGPGTSQAEFMRHPESHRLSRETQQQGTPAAGRESGIALPLSIRPHSTPALRPSCYVLPHAGRPCPPATRTCGKDLSGDHATSSRSSRWPRHQSSEATHAGGVAALMPWVKAGRWRGWGIDVESSHARPVMVAASPAPTCFPSGDTVHPCDRGKARRAVLAPLIEKLPVEWAWAIWAHLTTDQWPLLAYSTVCSYARTYSQAHKLYRTVDTPCPSCGSDGGSRQIFPEPDTARSIYEDLRSARRRAGAARAQPAMGVELGVRTSSVITALLVQSRAEHDSSTS